MNAYEDNIIRELKAWQQQMRQPASLASRLASRLQHKLNSLIPEKVHRLLTATIRQMVRGVLLGAGLTTPQKPAPASIFLQEAAVRRRISFYKKAAATEGGITGAGGFLWGLADFPLLLGLKLKLLFDIAAAYGHDIHDYRERLFLLHIFQLAFSSPQHRHRVYRQIENWQTQKQHLPPDIRQFDWRSFQQEYRDYIDLAKLAQLIPIIGAPVGALVNYRLIDKLGHTAMNAYRMRWLQQSL